MFDEASHPGMVIAVWSGASDLDVEGAASPNGTQEAVIVRPVETEIEYSMPPERRGYQGEPILSVVMPCFNEIDTIEEIVTRVLKSNFVGQLVVVDDGSTDGTRAYLETLSDNRVEVAFQPENRGKGFAIRTGFERCSFPFVIVQDADLEYDPAEYGLVLEPLMSGQADVVYGSRFLTGRPHRVLLFWHSLGNKFLTTLSNMLTNLNLTDMETCYKAFRLEVVQSLSLTEERFGIEPEITAKVARGGWRVWEVGISYAGRTFDEGKKIGWKDGVRAIVVLFKHTVGARWVSA